MIDGIVNGILNAIYGFIYLLWLAGAYIINIIEDLFRMLVGLQPVQSGFANGEDISVLIISNSYVQEIFLNLVALAVIMLIFFTILQIVREHYKDTKHGGNPYVIVFRMVKAIVLFMFVTAACLVGLQLAQIVLRALDRATGYDPDGGIGGMIFVAMASKANRVQQGLEGPGYIPDKNAYASAVAHDPNNKNWVWLEDMNKLEIYYGGDPQNRFEGEVALKAQWWHLFDNKYHDFWTEDTTPGHMLDNIAEREAMYGSLDWDKYDPGVWNTFDWNKPWENMTDAEKLAVLRRFPYSVRFNVGKLQYVKVGGTWYGPGTMGVLRSEIDDDGNVDYAGYVDVGNGVEGGEAGKQTVKYDNAPSNNSWYIPRSNEFVANNPDSVIKYHLWIMDSKGNSKRVARRWSGLSFGISNYIPEYSHQGFVFDRMWRNEDGTDTSDLFERGSLDPETGAANYHNYWRSFAIEMDSRGRPVAPVLREFGVLSGSYFYIDGVAKNGRGPGMAPLMLEYFHVNYKRPAGEVSGGWRGYAGYTAREKDEYIRWINNQMKRRRNVREVLRQHDDQAWFFKQKDHGKMQYSNVGAVNALYNMKDFNLIIGFGGLFIALGVFNGFAFAMIQRIAELGILYMFSPVTLAFFPFDDGTRFNNSFVKPFYQKAISSFAPVLSLNLFFVILPAFDEIEWFSSSVLNTLANCIVSIALLSMLPKVRATIQSMLGADAMDDKKLFGKGGVINDAVSKAANFPKAQVDRGREMLKNTVDTVQPYMNAASKVKAAAKLSNLKNPGAAINRAIQGRHERQAKDVDKILAQEGLKPGDAGYEERKKELTAKGIKGTMARSKANLDNQIKARGLATGAGGTVTEGDRIKFRGQLAKEAVERGMHTAAAKAVRAGQRTQQWAHDLPQNITEAVRTAAQYAQAMPWLVQDAAQAAWKAAKKAPGAIHDAAYDLGDKLLHGAGTVLNPFALADWLKEKQRDWSNAEGFKRFFSELVLSKEGFIPDVHRLIDSASSNNVISQMDKMHKAKEENEKAVVAATQLTHAAVVDAWKEKGKIARLEQDVELVTKILDPNLAHTLTTEELKRGYDLIAKKNSAGEAIIDAATGMPAALTLAEYKAENAKAVKGCMDEIGGKATETGMTTDKMMGMISKYEKSLTGDTAEYDKALSETNVTATLVYDKRKKFNELRTIASAEIVKEMVLNTNKAFGDMTAREKEFLHEGTNSELAYDAKYAEIVKRFEEGARGDFTSSTWTTKEIKKFQDLQTSPQEWAHMQEIIDIYKQLGDANDKEGQGDGEVARRNNYAKVVHMAELKTRAERKGQDVSRLKSQISNSESYIEQYCENLEQVKSQHHAAFSGVTLRTVADVYEMDRDARKDYADKLYAASRLITNDTERVQVNQSIQDLISNAAKRETNIAQLEKDQTDLSKTNAKIDKFMGKIGSSVVRS